MIDYEQFKEEMIASIKEADAIDGSGPDVHAKLLEIIFRDMRACWDLPEEALGEIDCVIKKIFGPVVEGIKLHLPARK